MPTRMALAALSAACICAAQPFAQYTIQRAQSPIIIDAKLDEPAWTAAPPAGDFHFNWFQSGDKEQTVAKMVWDDDNLYVSYYVRDKHISAYEKQRHGPVSKDDCVEIFLSPNPNKVKNYYTFEINAIGTMLNRNKADWWTGPPTWEPEGVVYKTTFHGADKKDESPDDDHWIVEMAIPFRNFARDAAHTPPREGDEWRLNLNRIGGKTNRQLSSWSPIAPPLTGFHSPDAFGIVRFVGEAASAPQRTRGGFTRRQRFNQADAKEGRELYNRSCTQCHGLDGNPGDRAPALGAARRYLRSTTEELRDSIKNGIRGTGMPGSPMSAGDIDKIIAFIHSLRATAIDVEVPGDRVQGERVFNGKGRCAECHMVGGRGGLLGPDLSNVGSERSLAALKEALTVVKPTAPRGFQPVRIVTTKGETIEGVVKNDHNFSKQVLGKDGKLHLLTKDMIREERYATKSLMPGNADKVLSADEYRDLLAYLSRLSRSRRPQ